MFSHKPQVDFKGGLPVNLTALCLSTETHLIRYYEV